MSVADGRPDLYTTLGQRLDPATREALERLSGEVTSGGPAPADVGRRAWRESVAADVRALAAAEGWGPVDLARWVGGFGVEAS